MRRVKVETPRAQHAIHRQACPPSFQQVRICLLWPWTG